MRVEFSRTILLCEAVLASILCAVMIAVAVATAIWWQAVGTNAPWFIQGIRLGSVASPFAANIMLAMLAMVVAGVASIIGVSRIAHAWREA